MVIEVSRINGEKHDEHEFPEFVNIFSSEENAEVIKIFVFSIAVKFS